MKRRWSWVWTTGGLASACAMGSQIDDQTLGAGGSGQGGASSAGGNADADGAAGAAGAAAGSGTAGIGAGGTGAGGGNGGAGGASGAAGAGSGGVASGGGGSGGAVSGGASSGGSATGGTGAGGSGGGSGGASGCSSGEKLCGGLCVPPSPAIGCSLTDCVACPSLPANATNLHCTATVCDFDCLSGYTKSGSACVPSGGGGTSGGGSGGTGGGTACVLPCDPSNPAIQFICAAVCIAGQGLGFCFPAPTTSGGCCGCLPI